MDTYAYLAHLTAEEKPFPLWLLPFITPKPMA